MDINILTQIVLPVLITSIVSLYLGKAQNRSIKVDIERKYKDMLGEEIEERRKLMDKFEKLEEENRKLRHAFTRAIAFIRSKLPQEEIPDFFLDTGDLKK